MGKGNPHFKDGERCGFCWEEFPCRGYTHNDVSGLQAWKLQDDLVRSQELAKEQREADLQRRRLHVLVGEGFQLLGLPLADLPRPEWASHSITLPVETVAELVRKALDEQRPTTPARKVAPRGVNRNRRR